MVVPDLELICEIMLVAEGFLEAKFLARKFITLYKLCRELLSAQDHYDWGLRAIKSLLVVAGTLKVTCELEKKHELDWKSKRTFKDYLKLVILLNEARKLLKSCEFLSK